MKKLENTKKLEFFNSALTAKIPERHCELDVEREKVVNHSRRQRSRAQLVDG